MMSFSIFLEAGVLSVSWLDLLVEDGAPLYMVADMFTTLLTVAYWLLKIYLPPLGL